MSAVLLLTTGTSAEVLPALGLLEHQVRVAAPDAVALLDETDADVVVVDGRGDLARARDLCRLLHATGAGQPLFAVVTEGGLAAVTAEWNIDDVLLDTAGPAEVQARLRLASGRLAASGTGETRGRFARAISRSTKAPTRHGCGDRRST